MKQQLAISNWQLAGRVLQMIVATLREIFDESAYDRYLARTQSARSRVSYRAFLAEREIAAARRPRCC